MLEKKGGLPPKPFNRTGTLGQPMENSSPKNTSRDSPSKGTSVPVPGSVSYSNKSKSVAPRYAPSKTVQVSSSTRPGKRISQVDGPNNMIYSSIKRLSKQEGLDGSGLLFVDDELEQWAVQDEDSDALSQ